MRRVTENNNKHDNIHIMVENNSNNDIQREKKELRRKNDLMFLCLSPTISFHAKKRLHSLIYTHCDDKED